MTDKESSERTYQRLSDKILAALLLALEQRDLALADMLSRALEMSMTRGAGGAGFVERRDFTSEVEGAFDRLAGLRKEARG